MMGHRYLDLSLLKNNQDYAYKKPNNLFSFFNTYSAEVILTTTLSNCIFEPHMSNSAFCKNTGKGSNNIIPQLIRVFVFNP